MSTMGERITAIMEAKGMTNTAFATTLNVSQSFISRSPLERKFPVIAL